MDMSQSRFSFTLFISIASIIMIFLGSSMPGNAAPVRTILEAQQAVDNAWEVYHQAALSGTIATPAIQNQIEADLDKVRSLLVEARDAEKTEPRRLDDLLKKIEILAQKIVNASRLVKP